MLGKSKLNSKIAERMLAQSLVLFKQRELAYAPVGKPILRCRLDSRECDRERPNDVGTSRIAELRRGD